MKKLFFSLVLTTISVMAVTVMDKATYNKTWVPPSIYAQSTEYYEFRFTLTTPYGVVLKDSEGNVVLNEKNSPVIVFNEVSMQWRALLRVQNYKDNAKMEWATLEVVEDRGVLPDSTGGISWSEAKGITMVNVLMESGECRTFFKVPFYTPDRGIGLGKATCLTTGSCAMQVKHGKMVITTGTGAVTGYGENDSAALEMAEPATPLVPTPIDSLSVYGTVRVYRYDGEMNFKQLRNILKTATTVKVIRK